MHASKGIAHRAPICGCVADHALIAAKHFEDWKIDKEGDKE